MMISTEKNRCNFFKRIVLLGAHRAGIYSQVSVLLIIIINLILMMPAWCQEKQDQPVLTKAVMCEDLKESNPHNPGIVFSSTLGRIVCYTDFDPVPVKTFIYHKYYLKDKLSSKVKLTLNPPRWATFSRIQLRETDKGPWRVEITDENDNILHVIRFSITD
jgi:hypothetical protein